MKNYGKIQEWRDVKIEKWKIDPKSHRSTMVMRFIVPVEGVPFLNQTRVLKTIEIVERNADCIIIEIENQTLDTPYAGDTFCCRECWIAVEV